MKNLENVDSAVVNISQDPAEFFAEYNSLEEGKELVVHDSTDPVYLYDHLLTEKGHTFTWEYLNDGPDLWVVKIIKQKDQVLSTLGQLAAADFCNAQVFRKYKLDFCFSGKKTLHDACEEQNILADNVLKELHSACLQPSINNVNYNSWELDFMADFIVSNHHQFVKESVLRIQELSRKLETIHPSHSNLFSINQVFQQLAVEVNENMIKEEQILFPYIRFLVQVKKGKVAASCLPGCVQQCISILEAEHGTIGHYMNYVNTLTDNYSLPQSAGSSFKLLYKWLHAFEDDLQQHVHLENNILFPKAIELEKEYHDKCTTFKSDPIKLPVFSADRRDLL
ncbi:MAG: DUF542 domain-containing protein [Chitinophagaceae bacterium]